MIKILILPILLSFHPVHVTVTTIDQVQGTDSMKVFFRMYYDDFLREYKLYDPECNLIEISADNSFPVDMANNYFNNRVQIYINNKRLKGKLLALNVQGYEIFLKLIYLSDKAPKKIKIRNKVLTGLYSDQTNMIFININKNEEAMRLTPEHDRESWSFNN